MYAHHKKIHIFIELLQVECLNKTMLTIGLLLLCLYYQVASLANPNNYFDFSISYIKEDLDRKLGESFYHIIILKVNINVNAQYVETTVDEEIDRLIEKHDVECRGILTNYKKKLLENCRMEEDFKLLDEVRGRFKELNEVACLTEEVCTEMNPLKTQAEGLERCELSKIADLSHQIGVVAEEFETAKKKLFGDHDRCIRDLLGHAYSDLARIVYEVCKITHRAAVNHQRQH